MADTLEVVILGCGSSGGVPRGDGNWGACDPQNPRNLRTRSSALFRRIGSDGVTNVVVDTSPEFRQQMVMAGVKHLDAVLYTHDHADQTHGIDDIRVFFIQGGQRIPVWLDQATYDSLMKRFGYVFEFQNNYPAIAEAHLIPPHGTRWSVDGAGGAVPVVTFDQAHGNIRAVGYRIGGHNGTGGVVYSPDVSDLDETAIEAVRGADLWIVDALRYHPHPTHAHLDKTLGWIADAGVKRAVLTNLHIDMDYETLNKRLPAGVEAGFDGWTARFPLD
ncbi:MBL fold metallo-hydrolase [Brevundimonas sp. BH3]|uniref:MBL fold metallo-hydrolase n=1 Tax=Brevundimonas sp. BH3 TaxID=3133089 RepID=UPI003244B122